MAKQVLALLAVLAVVLPASSGVADDKPALHLRATPRFSFSPANILFTAELKGGDDLEDYYCPEVEWEWDDGGRSVTESDCDPWEEGQKIERRFSARHQFVRAGKYRVRVRLSKSDDIIAQQTMTIDVRPGVGDPTGVY